MAMALGLASAVFPTARSSTLLRVRHYRAHNYRRRSPQRPWLSGGGAGSVERSTLASRPRSSWQGRLRPTRRSAGTRSSALRREAATRSSRHCALRRCSSPSPPALLESKISNITFDSGQFDRSHVKNRVRMQKLWPVEVCRQKLPKTARHVPSFFLTENYVRRGVAGLAPCPLLSFFRCFFTDGTGKETLSRGKGCGGGNEGGGGSGRWM
jgi:hypothetical protein